MKEKTLEGANFWKKDESDPNLTVWKFQDFCITEILREINFEYPRSAKSAVFAILGAVKFVHLANFSLQKVQKFIKSQFRASKCVKMVDFVPVES